MFDRYLYGKVYFYSWIMMSIAVIYVFVDFSALYEKHLDKILENYDKLKFKFITDFQRSNPLFGQQYRKEFRNYLQDQIKNNREKYNTHEVIGMEWICKVYDRQSLDEFGQFDNLNMKYTKWNYPLDWWQIHY